MSRFEADDGSCTFCELISGELVPKTSLYCVEEEDRYRRGLYVLAPLNPVTPGHMLFIPGRHVADALEDPQVTAHVMEWVARLVKFECNIITSVGSKATQTVGHLHVHVLPRHENDGVTLPWP